MAMEARQHASTERWAFWSSTLGVRLLGLFVAGGAIGIQVLVNLAVQALFGSRVDYRVSILFTGVAFAGLLQAVTGMWWWELSSRWSSLRPWQRGVVSLLVVVGAVALAVAVVWYSAQ